MRIRKLFLSLVLFVTLLIPRYSYAQEDENLIVDIEEWEEIKSIVYGDNQLLHDMNLNTSEVVITGDENNDINKAEQGYKLYSLTSSDFISEVQMGKTLGELISSEYVWIVPTTDNQKIRVIQKNKEWTISGYSAPSSVVAITDIVDLSVIDNDQKNNLFGEMNVERVQCFEAPLYHTNFIYYLTNQGEFLIPYGSRPDLTGLENGCIYSVHQVCEILKTDDIDSNNSNVFGFGGLPSKKLETEKVYLKSEIGWGVVGCLVVFIVGFLFWRRERRVRIKER